jgi:MinD-like ATPase involved in chromosome partitioning or flagellar assembly
VIIAILSGKAAPGVTTTTWALALSWPGEVLAIDADPAGGDMMAGLLAGRAGADQGLLSWSITSRRETTMDAAATLGGHTVTPPEAPHVSLMPGLQSAAQAASLASGGWDRLARALERPSVGGRDVLVDCGRVCEASAWPVIGVADRVLLVARGTVRSVHAARNAAALLQERRGDLAGVGLILVAAGPYRASAASAELKVPTAGELPDDRATADVLSDGATVGMRGLPRTKLLRAARSIAETLHPTSIQQHGQIRVSR